MTCRWHARAEPGSSPQALGANCARFDDFPILIKLIDASKELSNNFGWRDIPLADALYERLGLPVHISNDANCAALGEVVAGAAKGCRSAVLLTLGTGVGSGIILGGRIFEGGGPGGAELENDAGMIGAANIS